MDPKMRALVDSLRRGYRPPSAGPADVANIVVRPAAKSGQVPPESVPRMSSEDYRTGQFLRGLPDRLPPPVQIQALAALLRAPSGGRNGRAVRESMNPVGD